MNELHILITLDIYHPESSENRIGDIGAQHFREALPINKTLMEVTLKDNESSLCATVQMEHEIMHESICITVDWTGYQIRNEKLECLSAALKKNYITTRLILDENQIDDNGIQLLADGLLKNKILQELSLRNNRIGDKGMKYIANVLRENMTLNTLNLSKSSIGNDEVKHLADVLKDNVTLITLILSNNLIGDDGAKHLVESIQNNTKLITLNLENNRIGDGGTQKIATALNINTTLCKISLNGNGTYLCVVVGVLYQQRRGNMPTSLNFSKHCIKDEQVLILTQSLTDNKSLIELDISSNQIGKNGVQHLANVLENNIASLIILVFA
ncbi:unnamed protein product [Rotaria socialis]|uniref:Uncharacterized protein n=1 Tax=Rotaria socialis TaxID=392032 RepID=A0A818A6I7_9BILA|nr:unnamed protein product [Rotaria socialis]